VRVLVDYRPALRARTGVGEYVHEMVRALAGPGGPATPGSLTLFTASWTDRLAVGVTQELRIPAVDRRLPVRALTWSWNRLRFPPVEWLAGPVDLAHSATPLAIPSRTARTVLTIHDLHFLRHPERVTAEMRRDFPRLVRSHAARAEAIVVSSRYTADDVARTLGVPASRIHLCPPGAPRWAADIRRRRQDLAPRHILFIGTLDARKNVGTLLEAYAQLTGRRPDAPPLVIAGGMTPAGVRWQDEARARHLAGLVQWRGYVDEGTRQELYAAAHMLVLPSLDEGFGLTAHEALACGTPVVAYRVPALSEGLEGNPGVRLVPRGDVAALLATVEEVAGMEAAPPTRTWHAVARETIAVYERALTA